ncbi:serine/threonine-protein kinase pim-2-like [Polypterus senegalus]|uniref:serine/threonine-protein kinase pim-2-like n=1 Tax=Polypterus senegalus TaxID=55291 RepID=UPI00196551CE|nr:serine/threonine-protein kinase pim-2-like [Polypterus senegalus]
MGGYRKTRTRKIKKIKTDAKDKEGHGTTLKHLEEFDSSSSDVDSEEASRNNRRRDDLSSSGARSGACSTSSRSVSESDDAKDWIAYLEDYDVESLLGKGAFGEVYAARKKLNGVPVAIKIMTRDSVADWIQMPGEQQLIPLEVALMKMAGRSPSSSLVIQLLDWCMDPYDVLLILERPEPCMDLRDFVFESEEYLEEPLVQHIFRQIVEAVKHCHSRGVFHRDVKMNNILIQLHTCQIKLIDFGCGAQLQEGEYNSYRGTLEYAPPECFIEQRYLAVPATVWSLGVVLYALVCGFLPFETREETIKGKVTFPRKVSRACRDLIRRCLSHGPKDRPSLQDITKHSWMI